MKKIFSVFFVLILFIAACVSPYPGDQNNDPVGTKGTLAFDKAEYNPYGGRFIVLDLVDPDLTADSVDVSITSSKPGSVAVEITLSKIAPGQYSYDEEVGNTHWTTSNLIIEDDTVTITATYQDANPNKSITATTTIRHYNA